MAKKLPNIDPQELSHAPDALKGGLKCVFSDKRKVTIGTGTTRQSHQQNVYWYVEQIAPERFGVWMLNENGVPTGKRKEVGKDELLSSFYPELEYYNKHIAPKVLQMTMSVSRGEQCRSSSDFDGATEEFDKALQFDESNVRAVFGLGLTHLARGETHKAQHTFKDLIALEAAFTTEHKHLFNEMGIQLRKNALFAESVAFYQRAHELSDKDENLLYNLARAYFEGNDWPGCLRWLDKCLQLNPALKEALDLLHLAIEMIGNEKVRTQFDKPHLDTERAEQAQALWDRTLGLDIDLD
ncbi:MAG: tetratricopeptide repeat protein [Proteobacteria bacterium]|nr:tetratricopeptide repeat protein [Pseudomonadota bacterium]MBU1611339.1 tetratricopeptide repeat protein [Pseudomonadota bacterium]